MGCARKKVFMICAQSWFYVLTAILDQGLFPSFELVGWKANRFGLWSAPSTPSGAPVVFFPHVPRLKKPSSQGSCRRMFLTDTTADESIGVSCRRWSIPSADTIGTLRDQSGTRVLAKYEPGERIDKWSLRSASWAERQVGRPGKLSR